MLRTIALRFGETFAPEYGTIEAHQQLINSNGFVWYGKMGSAVSDKVIADILKNENPKILLIRSGKAERYRAYVSEIKHEVPDRKFIPAYYAEQAGIFKTWFKVTAIK